MCRTLALPVMVILTPQYINVKGDTRSNRKRVENMWYHLSGQLANLFPLQMEICDAVRTSADINNCSGECLKLQSMIDQICGLISGTSSRGANPVPYRRIPRSSPSACLKAVPRAIAVSCAWVFGVYERNMKQKAYLLYDGHRCRGPLCTPSSKIIHHV